MQCEYQVQNNHFFLAVFAGAKQSSPTSIIANNNLCVEAKEGICGKNDVSELHFAQTDCKNKNSKFRLVKGMLVHHCTGNRVCAKNDNVKIGARLVVSKSCSKMNALKFKREGKVQFLSEKPSYGFCPA